MVQRADNLGNQSLVEPFAQLLQHHDLGPGQEHQNDPYNLRAVNRAFACERLFVWAFNLLVNEGLSKQSLRAREVAVVRVVPAEFDSWRRIQVDALALLHSLNRELEHVRLVITFH